MKKIMFNDRYGLTDAVLHGRKTMTRRIVLEKYAELADGMEGACILEGACYHLGEVVAVAQRYRDCVNDILVQWGHRTEIATLAFESDKGWSNKMFVKSHLMPHRIKINDIKVERLQDISDIDCLREGIFQFEDPFYKHRVGCYGYFGATKNFNTPKEAFASLIDKVSGKGTWDSNPWVFAYSFELEKGGEK